MKTTLTLVFTLLVGTAHQTAAQPKYAITDLGTIEPGAGVVPEGGINLSGQVAGWASHGSPFYLRAFRTSPNGTLSPGNGDLGTLGGEYSYGAAINANGQVTGYSYGSTFPQRAFRTGPNATINPADNLGTLGGTFSMGFGINTSGQVVGLSRGSNGPNRGFRTGPNQPINPLTDNLGSLAFPSSVTTAGTSFALAINDGGQVTGYSQNASGEFHAFRTGPNQPINPATDDLGTLGGASSFGRGINSSARVVGQSEAADGTRRAFRTAPNAPINPATDNLGSFGGDSYGWAINTGGDVVGIANTSDGVLNAFLYTGDTLTNLNGAIPSGTPWVRLEAAYGINDKGQIVGYGFVSGDSMPHAFRLDPPAVAIDNLRSEVAASGLSSGEQQALDSSLDNAEKSLAKGNANAAKNQLAAFVNKVEALRSSGRIDAATAEVWIAEATMLMATIG